MTLRRRALGRGLGRYSRAGAAGSRTVMPLSYAALRTASPSGP